MKSYGNIGFTSFLFFLLHLPFHLCHLHLASATNLSVLPLSLPQSLFLLFLLSSDSVAHPFPITLGCCLGPQHDPLYITTLVLSLCGPASLCCVCVCVHVRERENNSDHVAVTVSYLFSLLKCLDCAVMVFLNM